MIIFQEDVEFLEHYGVKGMRWGVRNDDDTSSAPSDAEKKTAKRKANAQKYIDKANSIQKEIDTVNSRKDLTGYQKQAANDRVRYLTQQKQDALVDAKRKEQGKLSQREKKIAKGAAIAAGILITYAAASALQKGEFNRLATKGKQMLSGQEGIPWKTKKSLSNPNLDVDGIMNNVVRQINPDYGGLGTKMNCRRCTFAYELRRRGYDVAATKTTNANGQNFAGLFNALNDPKADFLPTSKTGIVRSLMKKGSGAGPSDMQFAMDTFGPTGKIKVKAVSSWTESIFGDLAKQPNGARGELTMLWGGGGGHSVAWEIIGGKPVIFDAQSGKVFKDSFDLSKGLPSIKEAGFTRLDNVEVNPEFLMRWLKNA